MIVCGCERCTVGGEGGGKEWDKRAGIKRGEKKYRFSAKCKSVKDISAAHGHLH